MANAINFITGKCGVGASPVLLPRSDPMWDAICEALAKHSQKFGTKVKAREDGIEITH